jgi:hypothetical protein
VMGWCRSSDADLVVLVGSARRREEVQAKEPKQSHCGSISGTLCAMPIGDSREG